MSPLDAWAGPVFAVLVGVPFLVAHRRQVIRERMAARRAAWERKQQRRDRFR